MSDSDSDSDYLLYYTPPSSLGEDDVSRNLRLMEAIKKQDHEEVLSSLTDLNKWIIEMRTWYLRGKQKG